MGHLSAGKKCDSSLSEMIAEETYSTVYLSNGDMQQQDIEACTCKS